MTMLSACAAAAVMSVGYGVLAQSAPKAPSKEWPTYGHDAGGMRFSPLTQITPANVGGLEVAWTYHMKPPAPPPTTPAPQGRGRGRGGSGFNASEVTPLVVNGTMYIATPYSRVVAVD